MLSKLNVVKRTGFWVSRRTSQGRERWASKASNGKVYAAIAEVAQERVAGAERKKGEGGAIILVRGKYR